MGDAVLDAGVLTIQGGRSWAVGKALLEGEGFGVHLDRDPADHALVERVVAAAEAGAVLAGALDRWRTHAASAKAEGLSPFDTEGTDEAMAPLRAFVARDGLPVPLPQGMLDLVDEHGREMRARASIDDWSRTIGKLGHGREALARQAADRKLAIAELPDWPEWCEDIRVALASGRSLLKDTDCAPRLNRQGLQHCRVQRREPLHDRGHGIATGPSGQRRIMR